MREIDGSERIAQVNGTLANHKRSQIATNLKKQGTAPVLEVWKWWWRPEEH